MNAPSRRVHADLHLHTHFSDGTHAPAALVADLAANGIAVAAVTDHDNVDGVDPAIDAGERAGVRVVPGVELSAAKAGKEVHILGLFVRHRDTAFQARLRAFRAERVERGFRMVEKLRKLGLPVSHERLAAGVKEGAALGRPHIARMLLEAGAVSSIPEAFDRYLAQGRPGHVGKANLTPEQAIALVAEAGGKSFLAHPGSLRRDDWIASFARTGLCGIEAFHSDHDARTARRYVEMARQFGLLVSGGSDHHGSNKETADLLSGGLTREEFEALESRGPVTPDRR